MNLIHVYIYIDITGLHLNLTEGKPIGHESYKTLVNEDGIFWGKKGLRAELKADRICSREVIQKTKIFVTSLFTGVRHKTTRVV